MGFPELFEKTIGSIHFILAYNLMGWVSWPLYIFVFLASFSALWWPKMGFRNSLKKLFAQFILYWHLSLWGESLDPYTFSGSWPHFRPSGGQIFWPKMGFPELLAQFSVFLKNSHLCSTQLQNRNLNWIFLDELGSDQSGDILSSFMGIAYWICFWPIALCLLILSLFPVLVEPFA